MKCHCGRDVWLYDENTYTCKDGHHTPVGEPLEWDQLAPPKRTIHPAWFGVLGGAAVQLVAAVINHL